MHSDVTTGKQDKRAKIMVSNGKHANTIAARYERLRAKADEEAREAGQWPRRKGPQSILPITDHYERLQSKVRLERLGPADRQFIAALLTPTGKRRRWTI
jgi:hypothetical protein